MTMTTIKVPAELRDRLKEQASAEGRTLGTHLQHLLDQEARQQRLRAARQAVRNRPPDQEYLEEFRVWEGDAWS